MKRLLAALTLITCLSFPVFAGHTNPGGRWCECGTQDCFCDPGEQQGTLSVTTSQGDAPTEATYPTDAISELGLILVAALFYLRLKA